MTQPDPNTEFFIAYFSQDGRRFTLVNPPTHIELSIGARLRSVLPNKILSDNVVEDYTRVIEIKRKPNSNGQLYKFHGLTLNSLLGFFFSSARNRSGTLFRGSTEDPKPTRVST
jgi:hypothetical protein